MQNFIKNRRKQLGLTQLQLAKRVGVSHVSISSWERGDTAPKGKSLMRLAHGLEVELNTLIESFFGFEQDERASEASDHLDRCASTIKTLRLKAGLSQPELGALTGFSDVSISKWEAAKVQPKMDSLIALSRAFGVNMLDAVMDEDWLSESTGRTTAAYQKGYQDGQAAIKTSLKTLLT